MSILKPKPGGQGVAVGGGVASAAGAAIGTAVAPVIGTAIGAVAGEIVQGLFGGGDPGKKGWQQAAPEVRELWSHQRPGATFEQAFLTWMQQNHPDKFSSADTVKALRYQWAMEQDRGSLGNVSNPAFQPRGGWPAMVKLFADAFGIDLAASAEREKLRDPNWRGNGGDGVNPNYIHHTEIVRTGVTPAQADALQRAKDKQAAGLPLSAEEQAALDALAKGAGKPKVSVEGKLDLGTIVPLVIIALVAFLIFRR